MRTLSTEGAMCREDNCSDRCVHNQQLVHGATKFCSPRRPPSEKNWRKLKIDARIVTGFDQVAENSLHVLRAPCLDAQLDFNIAE